MMIPDPMVEKITLPIHAGSASHKPLPVADHCFHAWLRREDQNGVQMIGHEQAQTAFPYEFLVIMAQRSQNGVTDAGLR
jgi:hypothetical protein